MNKNKPLVSIIIPAYNRAHLIGETLDSVLAQTYTHWECIVVDDGSTDHTPQEVERYVQQEARFFYYTRPASRKPGGNSARAYGFEKCTGSWVCWFDSDDVMLPDYIQSKLPIIQHHPETDVIIAKTAHYNADFSKLIGVENRTCSSQDYLIDFIMQKVKWYMCDGMWKRTFLENKQLFDEDLRVGQDVDFHIRRLLEQPQISILDKVLTKYRRHPHNLTTGVDEIERGKELRKSVLKSIKNWCVLLEKHGKLTPEIKFFYQKTILRFLPYFYKDQEVLKQMKKQLMDLNVTNFKSLSVGCKFYAALISFRLTGKGQRFLK